MAMSRRGLLPRGHRLVQALAISRTDVPFGESPSKILRWLRKLVETQAAQGGDWRSAIDGLRPFTQELWRRLSVPARRSFLEHARAWWDVHRHRMAPEVEGRIAETIMDRRLADRHGCLQHEPGRGDRVRCFHRASAAEPGSASRSSPQWPGVTAVVAPWSRACAGRPSGSICPCELLSSVRQTRRRPLRGIWPAPGKGWRSRRKEPGLGRLGELLDLVFGQGQRDLDRPGGNDECLREAHAEIVPA